MPIRPVLGQSLVASPRKYRTLLYGVVLTGAGMVAMLGGNPTIRTTSSAEPSVTPTTTTTTMPKTKPAPALAPVSAPHGGTLVICGGGGIPDPVRNRFVELAGGPRARLVIIPTAHTRAEVPGAADSALDPWMARGAASVQIFHTRSRESANDAEFVRPLSEATGVWFGGGRQSLVTDAYLGTEVERQLKALLMRGGVIGGTSAGAALMTRVMIAGGRTKAELSEGFDFLPGAVVDQHFLRRNRLTRLLSVLSDHPNLIGLGIDESTALIFDVKSHLMNVIGDSYVVACVPGSVGHDARLEILKPGDQANLSTMKNLDDPSLAIAPAAAREAL